LTTPITPSTQALRLRAEALAQNYLSEDLLNGNKLSPAQAIETLHELRVHQIELEMEIEELRCTQYALEISRARYIDFYELAPVGYCTLTEKGLICEVNLTTATLLNVPRGQLIKQPIGNFIFNDDQGVYYQLRHRLRNTDKTLSCELRLLKRDSTPFWAHLVVCVVQYDDGGSELRMVITDITDRKVLEERATLLANVELAYQNEEKGKRAAELVVANVELAFQNEEKEKRAAELVVANVERAKDKKESEELWKLSFYDPLTNLPNRRLLSDRMTQIMAASRRTGDHVALMMVDLDNFKPLNDLHGHVMGDLLLVDVGRRLMACVRGVDTVARFGGDEFVVVMGGLDVDRVKSTEQAREVAEKVRLSLSQPYLLKVPPADSPDRVIEHHCSVSVGVVVFVNHESNHDDVLKLADAAMYEAKAAGRNTIKFHETNGQLRMTAVRKTD
jgi:diguanylate cyclase (GGDEF)-like protein/PAS domain S-box-containing protein